MSFKGLSRNSFHLHKNRDTRFNNHFKNKYLLDIRKHNKHPKNSSQQPHQTYNQLIKVNFDILNQQELQANHTFHGFLNPKQNSNMLTRYSPGNEASVNKQYQEGIQKSPIESKARNDLKNRAQSGYQGKKEGNMKKESKLSRKSNEKKQYKQGQKDFNILISIYQMLSIIVKKIKQGINVVDQIEQYIKKCMRIKIFDQMLLRLNKQDQKILRNSRVLEIISLLNYYFVNLNHMQKQYQTEVINTLTLCMSNDLLLLRSLQIPQSFNNKLLKYQVNTFLKPLAPFQIYHRIHNNNCTLAILVYKTARQDFDYYKSIKKYIWQKQSMHGAYRHLLQYFVFYLHRNNLNGKIKFVDVCPSPFIYSLKKYHLVIQPKNVLVHIKQLKQEEVVLIRPNTLPFLKKMQEFFKIIFYTQSMPSEIEWVLSKLDPDNKITRLYRYHCIKKGQIYVKDLELIGVNLNSCIMLQSDKSKVSPELNCFKVSKWKGKKSDRLLQRFEQVLSKFPCERLGVRQFSLRHCQQLL